MLEAFRSSPVVQPISRPALRASMCCEPVVAHWLSSRKPQGLRESQCVSDAWRGGSRLNKGDVLSPANRRVVVQRLDRSDRHEEWKEVVVEDRRATPADTACARLVLAQWFRSLPRRNRRIAQTLATGESSGLTLIAPLQLAQFWDQFIVEYNCADRSSADRKAAHSELQSGCVAGARPLRSPDPSPSAT